MYIIIDLKNNKITRMLCDIWHFLQIESCDVIPESYTFCIEKGIIHHFLLSLKVFLKQKPTASRWWAGRYVGRVA